MHYDGFDYHDLPFAPAFGSDGTYTASDVTYQAFDGRPRAALR